MLKYLLPKVENSNSIIILKTLLLLVVVRISVSIPMIGQGMRLPQNQLEDLTLTFPLLIFLAIILFPLIETAVLMLLIEAGKKLKIKKIFLITAVAIFFSFLHITENFSSSILAFFSFLIYGFVYSVVREQSRFRAFKLASIAHGLRNALTFCVLMLLNYFT